MKTPQEPAKSRMTRLRRFNRWLLQPPGPMGNIVIVLGPAILAILGIIVALVLGLLVWLRGGL